MSDHTTRVKLSQGDLFSFPTQSILADARILVAQGWTQTVLARDKEGKECEPAGDEPCSWCLTGAVACALNRRVHAKLVEMDQAPWVEEVLTWRANKEYLYNAEGSIRRLIEEANGMCRLSFLWNDHKGRTAEEVIAAIDQTIHHIQGDVS